MHYSVPYLFDFDLPARDGRATCTQFLSQDTPQTVRNKLEKLDCKGKAIFDIPFVIRIHAESMKKNPGSPLGSTS